MKEVCVCVCLIHSLCSWPLRSPMSLWEPHWCLPSALPPFWGLLFLKSQPPPGTGVLGAASSLELRCVDTTVPKPGTDRRDALLLPRVRALRVLLLLLLGLWFGEEGGATADVSPTLQVPTDIFTTILCPRYYHPHFTEETEALRAHAIASQWQSWGLQPRPL